VATAPAARRSGYARRLLAALLAEVREHGQPVSCLYPFRESFYERLGYATFPLPRDATLRPDALGPALRMALPGQVTQHLTADVLPSYDAYVRKLQKRRHGMAVFDHPDEKAAELFPRWVALARVNGEVEGMMQYTLEGDQVTQLKMRVGRFYYHTPRGRYLLLNWIARHVDQASEVELSLAPDEWPETWLADMRVKVSTAVRAPMGRVLNMSGVGGMASGPGRITVAISDDFCPWNEGIWQLETVNGRLQVSRGKEAACTLTAQAVAALIYGTHDPADFPLRGWGNPTPDQAAQLRAMFPPQLPFLHEYY
jgi:predicted acetyltransferase